MSMEQAIRRLWIVILALCGLIAFGTLAFHLAERLNPFDSLYLTITVLSTVGFGDIVPETASGRMIYMMLVLVGIGIFGYAVSSIASLMAERSVFKLARGFLFLGGEEKLRDHVIVVGWNRVSKFVCDEMRVNGQKVVLIVEDDERGREASRAGYDALVGSPLEEGTFKAARIDSARAVVLTEDDPSKNLMTVLRVRGLSKEVKIIVVCSDDLMRSLFYRAGADRVINLANVSGRILASFVFEPLVAEVIEDLSEARIGLDARQLTFRAGRSYTVGELRSRGLKGIIFMVMRGEKKHYYPGESFALEPGDIIVLAGLRDHLDHDEKLLEGL